MITYKTLPNGNVKVYLDNKFVGTIKPISQSFAYYPQGSKTAGEILPTIAAVKATLEAM